MEIRGSFLNGHPDAKSADYIVENNNYCKVVKHMNVAPVSVSYGKANEWENFRPIDICFKTTDKNIPNIKKRGRLVIISVPKHGQLEISIIPKLSQDQLKKSASKIGSSEQNSRLEKDESIYREYMDNHIVPVSSEIRLKAIYEFDVPRRLPNIFCDAIQKRRYGDNDTNKPMQSCKAIKSEPNELASFRGYVELDSASSSKVKLAASWKDINDDIRLDNHNHVEGSTATVARDVAFKKYDPGLPDLKHATNFEFPGHSLDLDTLTPKSLRSTRYNFFDQFSLQCKEDKVFYGTPPNDADTLSDSVITEKIELLNFSDNRRKVAKLRALVSPRIQSAEDNLFSSSSVLLDVPSGVELPAPSIAFVIPIVSDDELEEPKYGHQKKYGLRVFVNRPAFISGPGERIAIGCASINTINDDSDGSLNKFITQWGEDPVERMGLEVTNRLPRASSFGTLADYSSDSKHYGLDEDLYPKNVAGGRESVIYIDNIENPKKRDASENRNISIASYALRFDDQLKLWYFDILMNDLFYGWCGFALYRHQPHSLDQFELSINPDWVYGSFLYEGSVAWYKKNKLIHITVGPVYDSSLSYEVSSIKYSNGVSENMADEGREYSILELKSYPVSGSGKYFEITVKETKSPWNLVTKRFGKSVSSRVISD